MPQTTQTLLQGFEEAIASLRAAAPRNNNKGKQLKQWVSENFGEQARVSIVNEAKQAGNRAKEQLSQREDEHAIFIVTDDEAFSPLERNCRTLLYPDLRTVLLASAVEDEQVVPRLLIRNTKYNSPLELFYREAFPELRVEDFSMDDPDIDESDSFDQVDFENSIVPSSLKDDDPILMTVHDLINDDYAGIIFSGAPGTSKSWYARQIALKLAKGKTANVFFIQFHPGYQYEDFIESYIPTETGGFSLTDKVFLKASSLAQERPNESIIVIIDELSRTDVVRVFGEALTYIERDKRDLQFRLPSGRTCSIPQNLVILCTMNPWDRGVDELDLAFERRFAKIRFDPDPDRLRARLRISDLSDERQQRVEQFFNMLARHPNKLCRLGHAYFMKANTDESLRRLWDHQLAFHFERVLKNDDDQLEAIRAAWARVFQE